MDFKTLYTVGDSFTYGEELSSPQHAWPAVLCDLLGLDWDLVNEGRPGVSNVWCVKRTMNAILEHKPQLVVVGWTSCGRQEFADDQGIFTIWPGCTPHAYYLHPDQAQTVDRKTISNWLTINSQAVYEMRTWLRQIVLLQSLLKQCNIQYRFVNTFDNLNMLNNMTGMNDLVSMIDVDNFVGWPTSQMVDMMGDCPKGPGGHPLELGHQRIAEAIHETLCTTR